MSREDPVSVRLKAAAKGTSRNPHTKNRMNEYKDHQYFAGFDWASRHHQVVIVNSHGQLVAHFQFDNTAAGWELWQQRAREFAPLAVCFETSHGVLVERLVQTEGCTIYPLDSKAGKAYRDRKAPSGVKTDFRDAWAFADALRSDGHSWKRLEPADPLLAELRMLCRDELALIEERTALINQLRKTLEEYYSVALEAFDDWTLPAAWSFVQRFPTPAALAKAGKRKWEKFLHTHLLFHKKTVAQRRLELFAKALEFTAGDSITEAKSRLAQTRVKQLLLLQREIDGYREKIEGLFARHPDSNLFDSLPGAGPKLAPRLLAEIGQDRAAFKDAQALQCYAGTAPISFQSGQLHKTRIRWHCNATLRATVHLWADLSRKFCSWAQVYYKAARERGKTHACALRCLGQRWLKILWKMWQTNSCYNAELHTQNQIAHGSWLLQIKPS
jgi:transposase